MIIKQNIIKLEIILKELSHYGNIPLPENFYRPSKKINIKSNITKSKI